MESSISNGSDVLSLAHAGGSAIGLSATDTYGQFTLAAQIDRILPPIRQRRPIEAKGGFYPKLAVVGQAAIIASDDTP
jgi:hypothetical protein